MVYKTIADPTRRKILMSLARSSPKTASELQVAPARRLDATRKHLEHRLDGTFMDGLDARNGD